MNNTLKTVFFMTLLTLCFVFIGKYIGGNRGMTMALVIALGMNFFTYWFSDKIVLAMYGAKQVSPAEAPELHSIVANLVQKAGMPMPKVYIMNEAQPNAFATGRNPSHAAVAVTTGILRILTQEELAGVIGHELSHIRHRDILIGTLAATVAGAITYLAHIGHWMMLFGGRSSDDGEDGGNPMGGIFMIIIAPIAAMLIQMAISRSREYLADEGGAKLAGNPLYLANALRKLEAGAATIPMESATPATAHMFIMAPFSGGGILSLFSTHPPVNDRVRRLEQMLRSR